MAAKHRPARYLVRVDLERLAKNLARTHGEACDDLAAARWLTATKGGEESPFRQLPEWGLFACRADPRNLLADDEIQSLLDTGE